MLFTLPSNPRSQPAPTGLDGMPEFSTSLGCLDASHFLHPDTPDGAFYTLPVSSVSGGADIVVRGSAPGTLTLVPSTSVQKEHVMVRANREGKGSSWPRVRNPSVPDKGSPSISFFLSMCEPHRNPRNTSGQATSKQLLSLSLLS